MKTLKIFIILLIVTCISLSSSFGEEKNKSNNPLIEVQAVPLPKIPDIVKDKYLKNFEGKYESYKINDSHIIFYYTDQDPYEWMIYLDNDPRKHFNINTLVLILQPEGTMVYTGFKVKINKELRIEETNLYTTQEVFIKNISLRERTKISNNAEQTSENILYLIKNFKSKIQKDEEDKADKEAEKVLNRWVKLFNI